MQNAAQTEPLTARRAACNDWDGMTEIGEPLSSTLARNPRARTAYPVVFAVIAALATIAMIELFGSDLLASAEQNWAISDPLKPADAAVVLGGGFESRPAAAAQLYNSGLVSEILVSTAGENNSTSSNPINIDREALIKLGVPSSAIFEFGDHPTTTYEEVATLAASAQHHELHRVILRRRHSAAGACDGLPGTKFAVSDSTLESRH